TGIVPTPVAAGKACGDNSNKCVGASACDGSGAGGPGPAPPVPASTTCETYTCDPAKGVVGTPAASGLACGDNSNKCVGASACDGSGACVQGPAPAVPASTTCETYTCDPTKGVVGTPAASGFACGDNSNKCVGASACNGSGACVQGPAPTVPASTTCE